MARLNDLLSDGDPRVDILREGEVRDEGPVLLWVQRAQRATGNLAANLAVSIANALGREVVAVFCLLPAFPSATLRAYRFMGEGLNELPEAFAKRGIGWELRVGEPDEVIPDLARDLSAAIVVTDQNPLRIGREWRQAVADRLRVPLVAVDTDVVVPASLFPKEEWAARTIRPKINRLRGDFLVAVPNTHAKRKSRHRAGPGPLDAIDGLDLDRSVGPSPFLTGGPSEARKRLRHFVGGPLARYDTDRNRPEIDGSSRLSPYLHFGQIGPLEVALAVVQAGEDGAPKSGVDAFLDELIVQRELSINFALRNPDYDTFAGIPDWAKKTLAEHEKDPRPVLFDRDTLAAAETGDPLWDAAQRQMVRDGYMPNRLRMYWAKQILLWSKNAEEAFAHTVWLNDRYFLCGRDAIGYSNISWAVGGRHDRPFPPNKPIIGLVRPMGMAAMKRTFDVKAYIDQQRQADTR